MERPIVACLDRRLFNHGIGIHAESECVTTVGNDGVTWADLIGGDPANRTAVSHGIRHDLEVRRGGLGNRAVTIRQRIRGR